MNHKLLLIQRTIALLIILTLIVGLIVIYFIENYPKVEVRYVDRIIKEKEVVTEYISEIEGDKFIITGYSANDSQQGTNNIVATTFNLDYTRVNNLPIAASNCIPLYSIIEIEGLGGYIILDTGLGYKTDYGWEDDNWVDILFDSKEQAIDFGIQERLVRVIK